MSEIMLSILVILMGLIMLTGSVSSVVENANTNNEMAVNTGKDATDLNKDALSFLPSDANTTIIGANQAISLITKEKNNTYPSPAAISSLFDNTRIKQLARLLEPRYLITEKDSRESLAARSPPLV